MQIQTGLGAAAPRRRCHRGVRAHAAGSPNRVYVHPVFAAFELAAERD